MMISYLKLQRNVLLVSLIVFLFFFFVYLRLLEFEKGWGFSCQKWKLDAFFFIYCCFLVISGNVFYLVSSVAFNTTLFYQQLHIFYSQFLNSSQPCIYYTCMHPTYYFYCYYYYCFLVNNFHFVKNWKKKTSQERMLHFT